MKNKSNILSSTVLLFILVSFIFPAYAQGPTNPIDECTLSRDVNIFFKVGTGTPTQNVQTIKEDAVVSSVLANITGNVIRESGVMNTIGAVAGTNTEIQKRWGIICIVNTINVIVDWVFYILIAIVLLFIAFAAFLWMRSGGNAQQQAKAQDTIVAAIIGLVIALLSRLIPNIVTGIFS